MNRSEKAKEIGIILDRLYPNPPIPLEHNSAYTLLVAVMLSAQTTDKMVNKVTPQLFKKANTPELMATLEVETIQKLIQKIGLAPTKAKNLKKMAQQLIDGGGVQSDWKYLESLAGVGHKTASVVMSQGFGFPAFPVDTHIHRLAQQWELTNGKNVKQSEIDLKKVFPEKLWNKLHLQIIFYGRKYCQARSCDGMSCLICKSCFNRKTARKYNKA